MSTRFSIDEIFEMAVEIERHAAELYRRAARQARRAQTKQLFLSLAATELDHQKTFEQMQKDSSGAQMPSFDPDNQAALYLKALADAKGREGKASPAAKLSGSESTEQILRLAVEAEKDSVAFYVGLKDLVAERSSKDKLDAIIREEMSHIIQLGRLLTASG